MERQSVKEVKRADFVGNTRSDTYTAIRIPGQLTDKSEESLSPSRWEKMVRCLRTGNVSSEKARNMGRDQSLLEAKEVLLTQIWPAPV